MKTEAMGLAKANLLSRALPVLRAFAAQNPPYHSIVFKCTQDPLGVHALLAEMEKVSGIAPVLPPVREMLEIGGFRLRRHVAGKIWIENSAGEGMQTDEAKLEAVLEKFWRKEF